MGAFFFNGPGPGLARARVQPFFFKARPGPGPGPAVLFRGSGRPKVGPAIEFGRYRPRPPPALFVFANGVGKRFAM